ncbi:uncharacterized protein BT62DRAFT_25713 [Guyanagaster necrorhizus]|uniref:Uncharacterized protein n=1 Tax=Guyanagaster necrorhizus TaxID=856835 RepID=A0A9P8B078_9AGAR|nr:uncharacterized protein BT62DRAFT_25713 [Guyanagaster necrorhizus MCA 3950]KAG7452767.1 hypothetical protein BT62DRAFT_25713 [Guyanagaster necrorhizus MCA 3950]
MESSRDDVLRVNVDTQGDLQRIKVDYSRLFLSFVEEKIRIQGLESQREAMVAHAQQYLDRTFSMAQSNLRINGCNRPLDENDPDMEPFDEALDRRIWALADTRLGWHKIVAETRRTVPKEIEATLEKLISGERDADAADEDLDISIEEDTESLPGDEFLARRYPNIQDELQKAIAATNALEQAIPSQAERSLKYEHVSAEIKTLKP